MFTAQRSAGGGERFRGLRACGLDKTGLASVCLESSMEDVGSLGEAVLWGGRQQALMLLV